MKTILLSIAAFAAILNVSAQQLSNPGFEDWSYDDEWEVSEPDHWAPPSACMALNEVKTCKLFYSQSTDAHSGDAAIKVFAKDDEQTAEIDTETLPLIYMGENLSARPAKVVFWYKSNKAISAIALVQNNREEEGELEENIGTGMGTFTAASTYKKAEVTMFYESTEAPAHFILMFTFEGEDYADNDYFIIDDVELVYTDVTGTQKQKVTEIIGSNIIESHLELKNQVEEITVFNTTGMEVLSVNDANTVDFSNLSEGLYMVSLKTGNALQTLKVFKK